MTNPFQSVADYSFDPLMNSYKYFFDISQIFV